jgi:lysophospholipase L1-like esterase
VSARARVLAVLVAAVALVAVPAAGAAHHYWVVSLGDSYTAGNGAGNYAPGDFGCHRSFDSYPWRLRERLRAAGHGADNWHVACSGSVTAHLTSPYWVGARRLPAQVDEVPADVRAQADVVLLTTGGNDVGFSGIVTDCLVVTIAFGSCAARLDAAMAGLDGVVRATKDALRTIAVRMPGAQVVLVGYPKLTSPACWGSPWNGTLATLQNAFDSAQSALVAELRVELATTRLRFQRVSDVFEGRGPCAATATQLVHRVVVSPSWESFHPNRRGHQAVADALYANGAHAPR